MKDRLETLYLSYNRRRYIHPDPLEFIYRYETRADREIVGMIASALAFGRVGQILLALERVFKAMGPSPSDYLLTATRRSLSRDFEGFVYRFVRDRHLVDFLFGLSCLSRDFGSLEQCFCIGMSQDDETLVPAMAHLVRNIKAHGPDPGYLLADPEKGSACKRMNLFLRWMARKDRVDPGVWTTLEPDRLIVPLDTHMHTISGRLGLTERRQADMKTALEITRAFSKISAHDPVKYDFALTRFGIRAELDLSQI